MGNELILVVEDEETIADVIRSYLKKEGYQVAIANSGSEGLLQAKTIRPDLIILDLMLPDIHGEEICYAIRKDSSVPIIMLTAKSSQDDRIRGLSLGSDDYLIKPFSPRELALRVQNILRRVKGSAKLAETSYNQGDIVINHDKLSVSVKGSAVDLTSSEYKILSILAKNPGRPFTREELISKVQGYDFPGFDRVIDTHIKNLRRKLGDEPRDAKLIQTVYGVGYKFGGQRD